jgi:hypothetical protein
LSRAASFLKASRIVVNGPNILRVQCAYRLVSGGGSWLQFVATMNGAICSKFQLRAARRSSSSRTFNPKAAGSNPARPIQPERLRIGGAARSAPPKQREDCCTRGIPRSVAEDVAALELKLSAENPSLEVSIAAVVNAKSTTGLAGHQLPTGAGVEVAKCVSVDVGAEGRGTAAWASTTAICSVMILYRQVSGLVVFSTKT